MPYLADARPLYARAWRDGFALPAFNVCSAEMVRACVEAATALRAPLLLQTYPADLEQIAPPQMRALVQAYADAAPVPVALHLDHGPSVEAALRCLRAGYGSVMLDGAAMALDELVAAGGELARVAHAQGAALEVAAESFGGGGAEATLTRPADAARLAREGGADLIAVSVGSEHGQRSRLDLELLSEIQRAVAGPLVLHGGSGIPDDDLAAARERGVVKVNIGSALYRALRRVWLESADAGSHREVYARAREALAGVARDKLRACGAAGRA